MTVSRPNPFGAILQNNGVPEKVVTVLRDEIEVFSALREAHGRHEALLRAGVVEKDIQKINAAARSEPGRYDILSRPPVLHIEASQFTDLAPASARAFQSPSVQQDAALLAIHYAQFTSFSRDYGVTNEQLQKFEEVEGREFLAVRTAVMGMGLQL